MPVTEQHFVGFDPDNPFIELPGCPLDDKVLVAVWFEQWHFTGWSRFNKHNTGIGYLHGFAVFDLVGNFIGIGQCPALSTCGFGGNVTAPPGRPPTPQEWLDRARAACAPAGLPNPGTVQFCPSAAEVIGERAP